ncbi:hypothetical protein KP509_28G027600 [Ceratopteris richardii]|uniref:Uncharacterized protein n=2 Tax=Ceratopteris richardii TaxID=49495 RepID=A0A8T2RAJ7_CERRI|nr:hypothetical protein KP509_28G027600 [Ceratopteris richardii]
MTAPFDTTDGLTWADQWDYKSDKTPGLLDDAPVAKKPWRLWRGDGHQKRRQTAEGGGGGDGMQEKMKHGVDKAKTAASAGAKKLKSGTVSGYQWLKEQYHKRSHK